MPPRLTSAPEVNPRPVPVTIITLSALLALKPRHAWYISWVVWDRMAFSFSGRFSLHTATGPCSSHTMS